MLPAASAAQALASLHNHKMDDWESEGVSPPTHIHPIDSIRQYRTRADNSLKEWVSETDLHAKHSHSSLDLPAMRRANHLDVTSEPYPALGSDRPRNLFPSILSTSPPGRSSTLPPIQRHGSVNRPRKQSVSKRAREPQHRRQKSKEHMHIRRMSYDRKAQSAEPSSQLTAYGKRWEDLIDAATSATEDADEDRTPVRSLPTLESFQEKGKDVPLTNVLQI